MFREQTQSDSRRSRPLQFLRNRIVRLFVLFLIAPVFLACGDKSRKVVPTVAIPSNYRDWPRWTGPNLDNLSPEKGWTTEWPDDGPPILWEAKLGKGYSSFSVVNGRVFSIGYHKNKETVYCLDIDTGDSIWTHSYPCKLLPNLHAGGPTSTPTVDGLRVYTVSKEGHLFCLNFKNGEVVWKNTFKELFGSKVPAWGFSCSPFVMDDMLIVDAGRIAALNKKTGEVIWKTKPYQPGYGSATSISVDGKKYITVLNNEFLLVLDPKKGRVVDKLKWVTSFKTTSTTPLVSGNTIFISTGYKVGAALLKFKDRKLETLYKTKKMSNHFNNSVLHHGALYGFHGNSHNARIVKLVCMDYQTGKVNWEKRGFGCGSLMIADNKLIILSDQGELVIAETSTDSLKIIARAEVLTGRCWTIPILSNGRIFCRNDQGHVVCVDVRPLVK